MQPRDMRTYLWETLCRFVGLDPLTAKIDAVHEKLNVGRGTVQRIRGRDSWPAGDTLHVLAETFGLEVWQLLVPDLDPKHPPTLVPTAWPFGDRVDIDAIRALPPQQLSEAVGALNDLLRRHRAVHPAAEKLANLTEEYLASRGTPAPATPTPDRPLGKTAGASRDAASRPRGPKRPR
jgi:hypothetical protein